MSQDKSAHIKQAAADDGIKNPGGAAIAGVAAAYIGLVPVTSWLAKTGVLSSLVNGTVRLVPGYTSASGRIIPAMSALYIFWTFGASGAISAAGQAMAREEGLDNDEPRKHVNNLRGLPLRLRSAHYGLLENFPAFALAAALAQLLAPNNRVLVNLLGFHVIAKLFVFYPTYLLGVAPPRTLSHLSATAALINVCWRLATGAA
ncbi:hypothetical protein PMZ80_009331 [Knufia obscura]|uniref:MAPEG family protein n=1 Tax=Knufia obscura TaxID=1635080 RepID=A0ABR0RCM8_9EURO|nr:hypothetical protein PMZ80_009331 [Knufia obscura]